MGGKGAARPPESALSTMWHLRLPHPVLPALVAGVLDRLLSTPARRLTRWSDDLDDVWEPFLTEDDRPRA